MANTPTLLARLREATRASHAQLDAAVRITTAADYVRFLQASLAALEILEPVVAQAVPALVSVERVPAARADLAELHSTVLPPQPLAWAPTTASAGLGAAYVLEGSTLGGLVIAARVEALGITATRYLRLRGKHTSRRWHAFLEALDVSALHTTDAERGLVCDAACAAFQHYTDAYRAAGMVPLPMTSSRWIRVPRSRSISRARSSRTACCLPAVPPS